MPYSPSVDGRSHEVDVPEDMPLLWVLRDVLGLTGTRFGCGISRCGVCTVHMPTIAPAVANAVRTLTGEPVRRLPLRV